MHKGENGVLENMAYWIPLQCMIVVYNSSKCIWQSDADIVLIVNKVPLSHWCCDQDFAWPCNPLLRSCFTLASEWYPIRQAEDSKNPFAVCIFSLQWILPQLMLTMEELSQIKAWRGYWHHIMKTYARISEITSSTDPITRVQRISLSTVLQQLEQKQTLLKELDTQL